MPQGYRNAVVSWHRPPAAHAKTTADGYPFLTLEILNTGERLEVEPQTRTGRFSAADLDRLAHALRDTRRGNEHPFDPAVIDFVYDLQVHFHADVIRVISGYRTPGAHGHSNHGRGRAIDLIVPGTSDEDVAKYARSRGFAGVGTYPSSGFVHVDVRPSSYYWVDNSGPGQRNCEKATRSAEARANDALALAAGRRPPRPWTPPGSDVDTAWGERRSLRDTEVDDHDDSPEEDDLDEDHE